MAGLLNFTLGLATGNFLRGASAAAAALGSLLSVGSLIAKVGHEISEGGRLFDLGARLRESSGSLFKIEFALDQIGEASANAGPLITQVNKALGGFNDMGEPTKDVFEGIGLSVEKLKNMDAEGKIQTIGAALAKLPQDVATNIAYKIAGRGGAQSLLAVANSAKDFADALAFAAPQADIIARNAAAFDRIGDTFKQIGLRSRGFFAGIAEGAAPGLQFLLDKLNQIDLTEFGKRIGDALTIATQAFRENRLGELLTLSLNVAFEQSVNHFARLMQALFATLPDLMAASKAGSLGLLQRGSAFLSEIAAGQIGERINGLDPESPEFQAGFQQMQKFLEEADFARQEAAKNQIEAGRKAGDAFRAALGAQTFDLFGPENLDRLEKLSKQLLARAPQNAAGERPAGGFGGGLFAGDKSKRTTAEGNALERIGYVNFNHNMANDYARRAAIAAERNAKAAEEISKQNRAFQEWWMQKNFKFEDRLA